MALAYAVALIVFLFTIAAHRAARIGSLFDPGRGSRRGTPDQYGVGTSRFDS